MAKWSGKKVNPEQINNGNEYTVNDNVSIEELNGIVNNSFKAQEDAERALELATGANEANGTVVKINGEPQGTWDATFSQELYEESANICYQKVFDVDYGNNHYGVKLGTYPAGTYSIKSFNGGSTYLYVNGSIFKDDIHQGKVITLINENNALRLDAYNITDKEAFNVVLVDGETIPAENLQYNPNRHITNSEAEFLKDEHEASYNLWNNEEIGGIDESTGQDVYNANRWRTKDYIKVAPNTKYTLSATTSGNIYYIFYFYTSSLSFISADAKIGTSNTTTTPSNCEYVRCVVADTTTIISSNRQLTKSDVVLPYQPYNSASHITNGQADFLKEEFEKSYNLININKSTLNKYIDYNGVLHDSTVTNTTDYIEVNPNEKYTFNCVTDLAGERTIVFLDANKSKISHVTYIELPITISAPSNTKYIRIAYYNKATNVILNKGAESLPYQEWTGGNITKKYIEPVLLWKNGNPNVAFEPTDITVSNLDKFSKIIVVYKQDNDPYGLPKENVFDVKYGCFGYLLGTKVDNIGTLVSRAFKITNSTTVRFGGGNLGNTTSNNECIPIAVYGSNY